MYDAPTAVLRPECDDPPTTRFWALDSHESTTEIIPAVMDTQPDIGIHFGHLPAWPTVDPDEATAEARHALHRDHPPTCPHSNACYTDYNGSCHSAPARPAGVTVRRWCSSLMARCWAGVSPSLRSISVSRWSRSPKSALRDRAVELDGQRDGHTSILLDGDCDEGCVGDRACVTDVLNEAFQVVQR